MKVIGTVLYMMFDFWMFLFLYLMVEVYRLENFGVMLGYFISDMLTFCIMIVCFFFMFEKKIEVAIQRFVVKPE